MTKELKLEKANLLQKPPRKRLWWTFALGVLFFVGASFLTYNFFDGIKESKTGQENSVEQQREKIVFTNDFFDVSKVDYIVPLGELNGGYIETQTINGVMINIKKDSKGNAEPIEVYAPIDMILEDYSYFPDGNRPPQWHLGFRISDYVKLSFDHLSWVPEKIQKVTPQTPNSAYYPPKGKLSFKGGDLIAKTSGTNEAHNWNIYLHDNMHKNSFVNQERYEKIKQTYSYVNATCPFDYYDEVKKQTYLSLMGWAKAGQSKTCGSNSKDVKGTISGLWHLNKEGVQEDYIGFYATPFSIYKTSSGEIVLYEINRQRYILGTQNLTYKDPTVISYSHCYDLTLYGDDRSTKGYAYFKLISDTEMKMAYKPNGTCPMVFPDSTAATYYR